MALASDGIAVYALVELASFVAQELALTLLFIVSLDFVWLWHFPYLARQDLGLCLFVLTNISGDSRH